MTPSLETALAYFKHRSRGNDHQARAIASAFHLYGPLEDIDYVLTQYIPKLRARGTTDPIAEF